MNPVVVFSSKKGNTQKVALEIAQELNCKSIKISDEPDFSKIELQEYDVVFLGTWVRGGHALIPSLVGRVMVGCGWPASESGRLSSRLTHGMCRGDPSACLHHTNGSAPHVGHLVASWA